MKHPPHLPTGPHCLLSHLTVPGVGGGVGIEGKCHLQRVTGALVMKRIETGSGEGGETEGMASQVCKSTGQSWVKKRKKKS